MDSNIIGLSNNASLTTTADRFIALMASSMGFSTSSVQTAHYMPIAGTLSNFYLSVDTAAGVGITRTFAVYKNGVQTSLAVALPNTTSGNDTVNTVSFNAGDTLSLVTNATSTTTSPGFTRWTVKMTAASGVSALLQNSDGMLSNSVNTYLGVQGTNISTSASSDVAQVFPTNGTLKNAYFYLHSSPGVGKSYTATLYKNGIATSITGTISDSNTTSSDTTNTVAVTAGDILYWQVAPSGSPTIRAASFCLEFDPTINGESVLLYGSSTAPSTSAVRFQALTGSSTGMNATESNKTALTQAAVWKKLYVAYDASPGSGKQYQHQLSVNSSAGNPSVTIADTNTSANDSLNMKATSVGDTVTMKITPTGSPSTTGLNMKWGMVNVVGGSISITNTGGFMPFFR
jgi:hypothetical protein